MSGQQKTPENEIACQCGGTLYYQRMRPAVMTTVFGKVEYKRAYYAGCSCGEGIAPLDTRYALKAGAISAGLAQLMALTGIAFSFEESEKWLKEFLLFDVSENSIGSETKKMGLLQQKCEEQDIRASQNEKVLQDRLRQERQVPKRLYSSIESACKQIATQRLKRSGAQWLVEGAVLTAKARSAWLSNQWHILCSKRLALPLAIWQHLCAHQKNLCRARV